MLKAIIHNPPTPRTPDSETRFALVYDSSNDINLAIVDEFGNVSTYIAWLEIDEDKVSLGLHTGIDDARICKNPNGEIRTF